MLKTTVVFLGLVSLTLGAVSRRGLSPKPERFASVEGCYIPELDRVVPLGERAPSDTACEEYLCSETEVQIFSCAAVAPPPCNTETRLVADKTKQYPDCCPTYVCDEN